MKEGGFRLEYKYRLQVLSGIIHNNLEDGCRKGNYDDVVFVVVSKLFVDGGRILEDDKITVYGQYAGIYDYTTVLGAAQSIPQIDAKSVVINE